MRRTVRTAVVVLIALVMPLLPAGSGRAAYPGPGSDSFDSSAQVFITPVPGCAAPDLIIDEVLSGPTTVARGAPVTPPDGRTEIPTEIVSMSLTGTMVTIIEDPDRASLGRVKQQDAGEDFPADSFFDVFVEVTLNVLPAVVFENLTPVRMENVIHSLPPHGLPYLPPPGLCVPLAVEGTMVPVLWLIHAEHGPKTNRLCAVGSASGVIRDLVTGQPGSATFPVTVDIVYGTPSGATAAEIVEMDLQGGMWQSPHGPRRVDIYERARTGSPGTMAGLGPHIDSFFDVFSVVSLDGNLLPGPVPLRMKGILNPAPGAPGGLQLLAPVPVGPIQIEMLSLSLTSVQPCTTPYPPVDP